MGEGAPTLGSSNVEGPGSDNNNNGDAVNLFEDAVRPLASVFDQEKKSLASTGQEHAEDADHEVHSIQALGEGRHEREGYHPETKEIRRFPRSTHDNINNLSEMGGDGVGSSLGLSEGGGAGASNSGGNNLNDGDSSRSGSSIRSSINNIDNNKALNDHNDFFPTGGYFSPKYGFEFSGDEQQQMFDPTDFGIAMTTSNALPAMRAGGRRLSSEGILRAT